MSKIRSIAVVRRVYKLAASKKSVLLRKKKNGFKPPKRTHKCSEISEEMEVSSGKKTETGYDPATGTNWCHMPIEIRMMCIDEMDFKTRICLRGTSTVEKALVESKKYPVRSINIRYWYFVMESHKFDTEHTKDITNTQRTTREEARKQLALLKLVFKFCEIDRLSVNSDQMFEHENLRVPMPIQCSELTLDTIEPSFVIFLLRNCPKAMADINFLKIDHMPLSEIVTQPSVHTARSVRFTEVECQCFFPRLVQKWIDDNAEVGKELSFTTKNGDVSQMFFDEFITRILTIDDFGHGFCLRISTNCNNHILIKFDSNDGMKVVNCRIVEPGNFR